MTLKTNPLIGAVLSLKRQPNSDRALDILMQAANLVFPIMKKRGWKVKTMREFMPKDPKLLGINVNKGLEIRIRLRPHHSPSSFYPFDDILGTVLHELVHNRISPHNAQFNALLDELWREVDDLRAAGVTGQGARMGGRNAADSKKAAANAAERRLRLGLSNGGQRLGGTSAKRPDGLTPREAAAQAALRRHMDATKCGNGRGDVDEQGGDDEDDIEFVGESGPVCQPQQTQAAISAAGERRHKLMLGWPQSLAAVVEVVVLSDDDPDEADECHSKTMDADSDDEDIVLVTVCNATTK